MRGNCGEVGCTRVVVEAWGGGERGGGSGGEVVVGGDGGGRLGGTKTTRRGRMHVGISCAEIKEDVFLR